MNNKIYYPSFFSILLYFFSINLIAQNNFWVPTAAPFTGGMYQASLVDKHGNIYLTIESGGIFRSSDNGKIWAHSIFLDNYSFKMHSDQQGDIFASLYYEGMIKSQDYGHTWYKVYNGLSDNENIVSFCNVDSSEMLAATSSPGLIRSYDRGETWLTIDDFPESIGSISTLEQISTNEIYLGSLDSGLFRSTDGAISWNKVTSFTDPNPIKDIEILNSSRILIATNGGGIFKSDDNGNTWQNILTTTFNYFISIVKSPDGKIYACDAIKGVYQSENNGESWYYIGIYNEAIRSIACNNNGDLFIFSAGKGAFYKSENSSDLVQMNIPTQEVISLLSWKDYIFVGSGSSTYRSSNHGESWENIVVGDSAYYLSHNYVVDLLNTPGENLFAALIGAGIWKSSDLGNNWQRAFEINMYQADGFSLTVDKDNNIYAGIGDNYFNNSGGTIKKSTDNGKSWQEIDNNLPAGSPDKLFTTSNNTVLASVTYYGIYRTENQGNGWEISSEGLPMENFLAESFAENQKGEIFCGTGNNGVFISSDDGKSWKPSNVGISLERVMDIVMDNTDNIYISTLTGIYFSEDNGKTWEPKNSGLSNPTIFALAIDNDNYLYAGSYGTGVFRSLNPITSIKDKNVLLPKSFFLSQNYPNPFNPSTKINYSIPQISFVTLKVYDILGREITTLVNEEKPVGNYEINFDANNLSSGIYFYRIQVGSFSDTKKLILIR